jgi:hypothetical protein
MANLADKVDVAEQRPGRGRRWLPVVAAGTVVLLAAGVPIALSARGGERQNPAVATGTGTDHIVRDGDRIGGRVPVVALPGRPVQLCAPYVVLDVYPEPVPEPCRIAVIAAGLDLDRLIDRRERDGAVWGSTRVEGVYRAGTLTVTGQWDDPAPAAGADASAADPVPCPEPAGGWPRQPADTGPLLSALDRAVRSNAGTYNGPWVRYPYGWHLQDTSDRKGTEVYVVGTTGDLDGARRALAAVVPAQHLCVTRVSWSRSAMDAAEARLWSPQAKAAGISGAFGDVLGDRVTAQLVVLDEPASRFLAGVADGRVLAEPLLRKLS